MSAETGNFEEGPIEEPVREAAPEPVTGSPMILGDLMGIKVEMPPATMTTKTTLPFSDNCD